LIIFFISQFFVGISISSYYSIGLVYLDDNVNKKETPLYYGELIKSNKILQTIHSNINGYQTSINNYNARYLTYLKYEIFNFNPMVRTK